MAGETLVRRTSPCLEGIEIGPEMAFPEKDCVGVVGDGRRVIHPALHPGIVAVGSANVVRWDTVVIVSRVHDPAQGHLTLIVHAKNALSLRLGLAEGGEKHAGQNGDDRDHDQQLDQGKGANLPRNAVGGSIHAED